MSGAITSLPIRLHGLVFGSGLGFFAPLNHRSNIL